MEGTFDGGEGEGGIGGAAGQNTGRIKGAGERRDAVCRPAPLGGFEAHIAGHRGRHPHRAAGIGPERNDGRAFAQADTGAGARTAGRPVLDGVPWVPGRTPMGVGAEPAKGKFDAVGLTGDDRQLAADGAHHGAFGLPFFGQLLWRSGEDGKAGNAEDIFHRKRDALQRA